MDFKDKMQVEKDRAVFKLYKLKLQHPSKTLPVSNGFNARLALEILVKSLINNFLNSKRSCRKFETSMADMVKFVGKRIVV